MSGSCSIASNKAEKSLVGMSVCTTVIGAETPASRSVSMATVIGCSSLRPPAAPRSAMTTGSAPWTAAAADRAARSSPGRPKAASASARHCSNTPAAIHSSRRARSVVSDT